VLATRGSVVPLFLRQVKRGQPITITDPEMTRFVMTLNEAVALCLYAFENGANGDLFVQKAPAVSIRVLADAVLAAVGCDDHPIRVIGTRHGEKQFETLLSREEMVFAEDHDPYFRVAPDKRDLNYDAYLHEGEEQVTRQADFNSVNARQLGVEELAQVLRGLPYVRACLAGESLPDE
jgi:UDP-glucose 4-epimerase